MHSGDTGIPLRSNRYDSHFCIQEIPLFRYRSNWNDSHFCIQEIPVFRYRSNRYDSHFCIQEIPVFRSAPTGMTDIFAFRRAGILLYVLMRACITIRYSKKNSHGADSHSGT